DAAAEIADAQAASILLVDPNTKELHFMAFTSDSDSTHSQRLKRVPVPLNNSVAGAVVLEGRAIAINDVSEHPLHYRKADDSSGFRTQSLLGIPMKVREIVIGVLEAVNKLDGKRWTKNDINFLEILASQAAVAIENSSLVSKLTEAYQELSQLDKLKNDFIAIASHELRTPLGVILGYATFLKEESEGDASDHADAVLNSALRMRQIIEDMTNLRFLKIGEAELEFGPLPLSEIMMNALKDVQSLTEVHGHKLHYMVPPDDVRVNVDKTKIGMALTNVLNNAMKYSSPGGFIELTYEMHHPDVWIVVRDQGIGIPKDKLEHIFEEFFQVEDHMTRRHGGMGLGLSIARAVVKANRGRIWAVSPGEDKGSTFYISLPLA
ncbi:MAG TPA: GAF domain-containing sensor histidine kinase, partial [Aggregatilineales bacterium]|nr:GAF domain-containing sensor histidine kinase [Aggregatilineales bacterium]